VSICACRLQRLVCECGCPLLAGAVRPLWRALAICTLGHECRHPWWLHERLGRRLPVRQRHQLGHARCATAQRGVAKTLFAGASVACQATRRPAGYRHTLRSCRVPELRVRVREATRCEAAEARGRVARPRVRKRPKAQDGSSGSALPPKGCRWQFRMVANSSSAAHPEAGGGGAGAAALKFLT
jgi:hypothetical protein